MDNKQKIILVLGIFMFSILLFSTQNANITGFTTADNTTNETTTNETTTTETTSSETLSLTLSTDRIAQDDTIEGTITINFLDEVNAEEVLTASIGTSKEFTIEELLLSSGYELGYRDFEYEVTNAESTKNISFTTAGESYIGIQIPRYSEIESISFTIEGSTYSSSFPTSVKLDVGGEGTYDWFYLGDFINYTGTTLSSADLDGAYEGTGYIQDNDTYYCELISLPLGKHFNISATYTQVGTYGDMYATILSVPTGNPNYGWSGGADICDLPETAGSCQIEVAYPIEGTYMICIYSTGEYNSSEYIFSLPLDTTSSTDTAYSCPLAQDSLCEETGFSNFFIYAEAANYNNSLNGEAGLETWETFTSSIITGIKYYVGSEPFTGICNEEVCSVPISISTESAGVINLSNLQVDYDYNGVAQSTSTFYNLEIPVGNITEIDDSDLEEGLTATIALSLLNLSESDLGDYTLALSFLDATISETFSILTEDEIYDAASLIDTFSSRYEGYLDETTNEYQVLLMLERVQTIETILDTLDSLKPQVGFVDEDTLFANVQNLIEDEIWEITISTGSSDILVVEPSGIPSSLGDEEEIYLMQDSISVTGKEKNVNLEYYSGNTTSYTFIEKEIEAQETIEGLLYEKLPTDVESVLYSERPTITDDNLGKYSLSLSEGETSTFYYMAAETYGIEDFSTIVITEELEEEEEIVDQEFVYEKNISNSLFPTSTIIIIVIVLILALGLISLITFKDKIFKKKTSAYVKPSAPTQSSDPTVDFVKKAFAKGISEQTLIQTLKKKGWKEDKIKEVLRKAR
jgi:hypothetical protein